MPAIQPDWAIALPIQQQSVMLLATRGPDGVAKYHPAKNLIRAYRATVIKAAALGRMFGPLDDVHDTFMNATLLYGNEVTWALTCQTYLDHLDSLPLHYHLHFMHAVEIVGYKHPDPNVRARWNALYLTLVDDMHLNPETEAQMDARLNDFGCFAEGYPIHEN